MQVFYNGKILDLKEVAISPFDRAFQFGDGVYEVIRYYPSKFFKTELHLDRLKNSLKEIEIPYNNCDSIESTLNELMKLNKLTDEVSIGYIQISRGYHIPRRHYFDDGMEPTVFMYVEKYPARKEEMKNGVKVGLEEDIRWLRCNIKATSLLPNILSRNKAVRNGLSEIIWHRNGIITEGTQTNIFFVKNGELFTPPLSNFILPGVTRSVVLDLCGKNGIPFTERNFTIDELTKSDEIFLTSTTAEVTPVIEIEETNVKDLKPGPISRILQKEYSKLY